MSTSKRGGTDNSPTNRRISDCFGLLTVDAETAVRLLHVVRIHFKERQQLSRLLDTRARLFTHVTPRPQRRGPLSRVLLDRDHQTHRSIQSLTRGSENGMLCDALVVAAQSGQVQAYTRCKIAENLVRTNWEQETSHFAAKVKRTHITPQYTLPSLLAASIVCCWNKFLLHSCSAEHRSATTDCSANVIVAFSLVSFTPPELILRNFANPPFVLFWRCYT